jgi:hypothetical protein
VGAGTFFRLDPRDLPIVITAPTLAPLLAAAPATVPLKTNSESVGEIPEKNPATEPPPSLESEPAPKLAFDFPPAKPPLQTNRESTNNFPTIATTTPMPASLCRAKNDDTDVAAAAPDAPQQSAPANPPPAPAVALHSPPLNDSVKTNAASTNTVPAVLAQTPRRTALSLQVARVAGTEGTGLRLRASPSLSSWVLAVMPDGCRVTLLGDTQISGGYRWQKVQYGSQTGWAASDYLVFGVVAK